LDDLAVAELDAAHVITYQGYRKETKAFPTEIPDERVTDIGVSAGNAMLPKAGILDDPNVTDPDQTKWAKFRHLYRQKSDPKATWTQSRRRLELSRLANCSRLPFVTQLWYLQQCPMPAALGASVRLQTSLTLSSSMKQDDFEMTPSFPLSPPK